MSFYNTQNPSRFRAKYGQPPNNVPDCTLVQNWSFNMVNTNDLFVENCAIHLGEKAGSFKQSPSGTVAIGCYAGEQFQSEDS